MLLPSRARIGELARWVFFRQGERRLNWCELLPGLVIILAVSSVNTALQRNGLYDRWDWIDEDRLQQTALATGPGGISLVLITDDDYQVQFNATSPLDPDKLATLIEAVCKSDPLVVGVDFFTSEWPADSHEALVAQRMGNCPIVWISDDEIEEVGEGANQMFQVRVGKAIGQIVPHAGIRTASPAIQPDADHIIRRYMLSIPRLTTNESPPGSKDYPTMVAMLAGYARPPVARPPGDVPAGMQRIRYTSSKNFPRYTALEVRQLASDTSAGYRKRIEEAFGGRIVIIGAAYRQARDRHPTPIGSIHGAELIANAVYTELHDPIRDVPWWRSLALDIVVSLLLLLALAWSGLRWPWATLGAFILTAVVAMLISWNLYKFGGYFLGVLGGLMGVVLAELTSVVWQPLREMWRGWWRDYPAPVANGIGEVAPDARMIKLPAAAPHAIDKPASQPADRPTPQHPIGSSDP